MTEIIKKAKAAIKRVLIQVRMKEEDNRTLREFAKMAGMNISDFIRFCTLSKPPRTKMATPERELWLQLLSELGKIGSNVNQIAKAMNTDKKTFYSVFVKETLIVEVMESLKKVSSRILDELDHKDRHGGEGENSR